jgi:hypothetical protein
MSVLDMSGRIGHRARAVKHVMDVYRSVIMRPRFGAKEIDFKWTGFDSPSTSFVFKIDDSVFRLHCQLGYKAIRVYCRCIDNEDDWSVPFQFVENHPIENFGKIKQKALILMKKIAHKPVYDTMMI